MKSKKIQSILEFAKNASFNRASKNKVNKNKKYRNNIKQK